MKIHLVDGTYELFRNHFGAPPRKAADGREVGATLGLLRSLYALLSTTDVTHLAVAFDHVIESFRNDLYAGYKTGAGVDPSLLAQFPLAERAVSALGVVVWPMTEFEADDALATATKRFAKLGSVDQIVICSPDKDLAQLVSGKHVVCWDRRREIVLDEPGVLEKYGVHPEFHPRLASTRRRCRRRFPRHSGLGSQVCIGGAPALQTPGVRSPAMPGNGEWIPLRPDALPAWRNPWQRDARRPCSTGS